MEDILLNLFDPRNNFTHKMCTCYHKTSPSWRNGTKSGQYNSVKKNVVLELVGETPEYQHHMKHSTIHHQSREGPGGVSYQATREGEIHANYSGQVFLQPHSSHLPTPWPSHACSSHIAPLVNWPGLSHSPRIKPSVYWQCCVGVGFCEEAIHHSWHI